MSDPDPEFDRRVAFVRYMFDHHIGRPDHPHHPLRYLAQVRSKRPRDRAIRSTVTDTAMIALGWSPSMVAKADADLRALGAMTLTEVRDDSFVLYAKVMKRGRITNEDEFYLLRTFLDGNPNGSDIETDRLVALLDAFEFGGDA